MIFMLVVGAEWSVTPGVGAPVVHVYVGQREGALRDTPVLAGQLVRHGLVHLGGVLRENCIIIITTLSPHSRSISRWKYFLCNSKRKKDKEFRSFHAPHAMNSWLS